MFISCSVFSQNIEVKYYQNSIISDEKLKNMPPEFRTSFLQNTFSYTLKYSNGISFYKNDDFDDDFYKRTGIQKQIFIIDEKITEEDEQGNKTISSGTLVDNVQTLKNKEHLFYKDIQNNKVFVEMNEGADVYQVIDRPFEWNWKITDETKKIAGYTCRKAISNLMGYHFEAWYTEDIPVSAGPEKFDGLPGLILYANSGGAEFVAYSVKVLDKPITINKPVLKVKHILSLKSLTEQPEKTKIKTENKTLHYLKRNYYQAK